MKNLQSLLTEKGINTLVNQEMLLVKGGCGPHKRKSFKNKKSHKSYKSHGSFGSKGTNKGGITSPIVLVP